MGSLKDRADSLKATTGTSSLSTRVAGLKKSESAPTADMPLLGRFATGLHAGAEGIRNALGGLVGMEPKETFSNLDRMLREQGNVGENVAAGIGGAAPYFTPIGPAAFLAGLLTKPKETLTGMADLSAATTHAAYGRGLGDIIANMFQPFANGEPEAKEIVGRQPVEALMNAAMIAGAPKMAMGLGARLRGLKGKPAPKVGTKQGTKIAPETAQPEAIPSVAMDKTPGKIETGIEAAGPDRFSVMMQKARQLGHNRDNLSRNREALSPEKISQLEADIAQNEADLIGMGANPESVLGKVRAEAERVNAKNMGYIAEKYAGNLGIKYNGLQEGIGKVKPVHLFTDSETGSTFSVPFEHPDKVGEYLTKKRAEMTKPAPPVDPMFAKFEADLAKKEETVKQLQANLDEARSRGDNTTAGEIQGAIDSHQAEIAWQREQYEKAKAQAAPPVVEKAASHKYSVGTKLPDERIIRQTVFGTTGKGSEVPGYIVGREGTRVVNAISETDVTRLFEIAEKDKIFQAEQQKKIAEAQTKESAIKSALENTDGFADQMSPMTRKRTIDILNKNLSFDGKIKSRKEAIRERVANGWKVEVRASGERRFTAPDGSFLDEGAISKTGMDYAQYLPRKVPIIPPTELPKPQGSQSLVGGGVKGITPKPPVEAGKITELHAGINPFEYFRKGMQIAFGKRGEPGGRRLVSPIGTPEITLEGRGIVEPFHKAKPLYQKARTDFAGRANKLLEGIKRGSKEDTGLFDKLNDPGTKLEGSAAGIRDYFDELFNLMNEHRTARGQEPVRYQKGYITHIIDFAKEQQGLFQDARLPKSLRFAFEKRTGAGGYKRSAIDAVETYTDAALRDVFYGDALMKAIPKVEELTFGKNKPIVTTKTEVTADGKTTTKHFYDLGGAVWGTERAYAENFIKRQLGWPTNLQRAAQAVLRINPKTQSKISQAATGGFYRSLIGAALDTSLKNFTQITNTIGEFKGVPTLRGFSKMLTSRGRAAVKGENLLEEYTPLLHGGESIDLKGKVAQIGKAIDNTVLAGPMRFAEFFLRGTTYHTALDTYIKSGKSIEAAHQMARDAVRKLQFAYGKENISPYLQGPLMRPLYQFFSFPTKQTELMYRWATEGKGGQAKLFRYFALTGALVAGGKYAGVDLSGVFLDPLKMVDPDSKEGIKLPGTQKRFEFSIDKLARSGFIPQGPAPVVSAPLKVGKLALSGQDYERKKALSEAIKVFVPAGRYGSKVYQSIQEFRGEPVIGARGRLTRPASTKEAVLRLTGLRSPDTEVSWSRRDAVAMIEKEYYARRQKAIDLILENKGTEANKVLQSIVNDYPYLGEYLMNGLTERTLKAEAEKKTKTAEQRFFDPNVRKIIQVGLTHK